MMPGIPLKDTVPSCKALKNRELYEGIYLEEEKEEDYNTNGQNFSSTQS